MLMSVFIAQPDFDEDSAFSMPSRHLDMPEVTNSRHDIGDNSIPMDLPAKAATSLSVVELPSARSHKIS